MLIYNDFPNHIVDEQIKRVIAAMEMILHQTTQHI